KKLIAYSSVAHMGIVTIGIFTPNAIGISGSIFQMLSHGVVSSALFMIVGVVYDRIHSRDIEVYGGLAERMPIYAFTFMLFMMASVGLPGTSGFVGEVLVIIGVWQVSSWVATFAATGMILSAAYMLWLYRRVVFGGLTKDSLKLIRDMRFNEIVAFAPLVVLAILMGVYPTLFLDPMAASVDNLVSQITLPSATDTALTLPADR
ncbi:MAG: NADH-quinone oxidoreductase subunit M, partial [Geminicoccaceae bacterium]|nr:NADH-quinone oxidoreductase subunit M [Geminicoccaceae bacterium]